MRNDPQPFSRSQDCFPHDSFFHGHIIQPSFGTCTVLSPLSTDCTWPSSTVDSSDRLECILLLPLWFPHPLSMTQLYRQLQSFETYHMFETCDCRSIYGGTQGTRMCQGETSELGLVFSFFQVTLRTICPGIGLSQ